MSLPAFLTRRSTYVALGLVLATAGGWYALGRKPAATPQGEAAMGGPPGAPFGGAPGGGRRRGADGPVSVDVAKVELRDMAIFREGIGSVQANALVTVRAQVEGALLEVGFREGQMVKKGDVLARIDPAIYQAQYDQAMARKAQDEALLANARMDLKRYEQLAATNAGPRQQADQTRAQVAQLEATVKADQAAIDNARTYLGYTTITAPIDGRVGLRTLDPGNIVRASDASGLVSIAQIQPISVVFTLPQRDLAIVAEAMKAGPVGVEALDTDGRTGLSSGTLDVIDNQIDTATGTVKLKARFANADLRLWPGQFVTVRVKVREVKKARVVPTPAIRRSARGTFVFVAGADNVAQARPVSVAQQDETLAAIAEGLNEGEQVVTAGFARLTPGAAIVIVGDGQGTQGPRRERGAGQGNAPARAP